jgi:hypothetical protein
MKKTLLIAAAVGLALAAGPATALAADGNTIDIQDRCDPDSFQAQGVDCAPVTDQGTVTFDELIGSLIANQSNDGWRFKQEKLTIRQGQPLNLRLSRGGEAHTITEVPTFGLGCLDFINALVFPGQDPTAFPAACAAPETFTPGIFGGDLIFPGGNFSKTGLSKGTHRFQCMIHPWMNSTVTVR